MHPALGPLRSTYFLADSLKRKGHKIIYITPKKLSGEISAQGFDFFIEESIDLTETNTSIVNGKSKSSDENIDLNQARVVELTNKVINEYSPDMFILDSDQTIYAIALHKHAVRAIFVNTMIGGIKLKSIPPINSTYVPQGGFLSNIKIEIIWQWLFIKKKIWSLRFPKSSMVAKNKELVHFAKAQGFPLKKFICYDRTYEYGLKHIPEVYLAPKELDFFSNSKRSNIYFLGPMVATDRYEAKFDWSQIDRCKPVVFCSLGTSAHYYNQRVPLFFKRLIAVFRKFKDLELVLSVGKFIEFESLGDIPDNVHIYKDVPQLTVLKHSSLMISHGGLNSVKEAIINGVPLLVYPLNPHVDQNGNAARVVYHGLGKRGSINKDKEEKIAADIRNVLFGDFYKTNTHKMRNSFVKNNSSDYGCSLIEKLGELTTV